VITLSIIKPLNELSDIKTKKLAEFFNETLGFCPNSVLTMQKKPNLAEAFINLNKAVMENNGSLTPEFKRLIAFISSSAAGCRYCQAHTSLAAKRYGSSDKRLKAVWDYENSELFSKKEKIALKFTYFNSINPIQEDDQLKKLLLDEWSENDVLEIIGVIALFGFLNRWNDTMATELEELPEKVAQSTIKDTYGWDIGKHEQG